MPRRSYSLLSAKPSSIGYEMKVNAGEYVIGLWGRSLICSPKIRVSSRIGIALFIQYIYSFKESSYEHSFYL